jgi:hypothetical protein
LLSTLSPQCGAGRPVCADLRGQACLPDHALPAGSSDLSDLSDSSDFPRLLHRQPSDPHVPAPAKPAPAKLAFCAVLC